MNCLLLAITLSVTWHVAAGECEDTLPQCREILTSNVTLCHDDPHFASRYCKRSCGLCPISCYHCNSTSLEAAKHCNETQLCRLGAQCLTMTLLSSKDGHHQYVLTCANQHSCDGNGVHIPGLVGRSAVSSKRDLHVTCCKDDLCNRPDSLRDPQINATEMTPFIVEPTHLTTKLTTHMTSQTTTHLMTTSTTTKPSTSTSTTKATTLTPKTTTIATTTSTKSTFVTQTTTKPLPTTTTMDPVFISFCEYKDTIECPNDGTSVCGTNRIKYSNQCVFDKARCDDFALHVVVC
ncbi:uncharacterized protein LOC127855688 isoform X2 [Dreissena polymorpha]|uniref:ShKT domain-containing protein n=1 Tax=Dreissena polymorpha TaxID=45954 RepID=A0A9D4HLF9_DREPO|nr:uncharacterized protein LOC127855688 isoform X1 [Dreissena polymorpha]XP_052247431.1 uncharacterized protein LOC127855688 isoform X2 [Dreissena polymorpha]KAH3720831.1 hypothetical protein DPMN_063737 [Dreissena polymorpha]